MRGLSFVHLAGFHGLARQIDEAVANESEMAGKLARSVDAEETQADAIARTTASVVPAKRKPLTLIPP